MTTSIPSSMPAYSITECDFVARALSAYDAADAIVNVLDSQRKGNKIGRKAEMYQLRSYVQSLESNLWEALARDFPKFRFRRQNQTIVISYNGNQRGNEIGMRGGETVTINMGEVNKIKAWGVNDYYEALDTVNRLQNQLYNSGIVFNRRWMDDWNRLGKQLVIIDRRNCKSFAEPAPGPIVITPPPSIPKPPNPPGPDLPRWPLPPIVAQGDWSSYDARNWSITGWTNSQIVPMSGLQSNRPSIAMIAGRELIYFAPNGINTTKMLWLFHKTNGSAREWFTDYEKLKYIKKFLDAGYAVAAYNSYNRVSKKWAPSSNQATNKEILDLKACQDYLANLGILKRTCAITMSVNPQTGFVTNTQVCTYTTPQHGVGMASGGAILTYAAQALSISKIALHNSAGISQVVRNANYNVDTLWMMSANDISLSSSEATTNYNYLQANKPQLHASLVIQSGSKITASIFDDIPNVSTNVATSIVSGLLSAGFIESDGSLTTKYAVANKSTRETYMQNVISGIIATAFGGDVTNYRLYVGDIMDQLRISFSDHEFSGWERLANGTLVDRDLAFFQL